MVARILMKNNLMYLPNKDVSIRVIDENPSLLPLLEWPVGARRLRATDARILRRKRKIDKQTNCSLNQAHFGLIHSDTSKCFSEGFNIQFAKSATWV